MYIPNYTNIYYDEWITIQKALCFYRDSLYLSEEESEIVDDVIDRIDSKIYEYEEINGHKVYVPLRNMN